MPLHIASNHIKFFVQISRLEPRNFRFLSRHSTTTLWSRSNTNKTYIFYLFSIFGAWDLASGAGRSTVPLCGLATQFVTRQQWGPAQRHVDSTFQRYILQHIHWCAKNAKWYLVPCKNFLYCSQFRYCSSNFVLAKVVNLNHFASFYTSA